MGFASFYFDRFKSKKTLFKNNPCSDTGIIVVIPCYRDEFIFNTLNSLENAKLPKSKIEVIVIINSSELDSDIVLEQNQQIFDELFLRSRTSFYKNFKLLVHNEVGVPKKVAGVGNARKIGMDEAIRRFDTIEKPDGIILSLDADTLVENNYFTLIELAFVSNKANAAFFQFQHDFDTGIYSEQTIRACKLYEIYLRYFRLSLAYTGFPYSIHTIGSCFGVRALNYTKAGGMSKRQGGEDFYFLHKLAPQTPVFAIKDIIVKPSPRVSDRVPFGTGPAVASISKSMTYYVYNFKLFIDLKSFFDQFQTIYITNDFKRLCLPDSIFNYFGEEQLLLTIEECKKHTNNFEAFSKRMFTKIDAFAIVKFLNSFEKSENYANTCVIDAANELLTHYFNTHSPMQSEDEIYNKILALDLNI
jgi:hypothetical protein